jgi:hypothetical protein
MTRCLFQTRKMRGQPGGPGQCFGWFAFLLAVRSARHPGARRAPPADPSLHLPVPLPPPGSARVGPAPIARRLGVRAGGRLTEGSLAPSRAGSALAARRLLARGGELPSESDPPGPAPKLETRCPTRTVALPGALARSYWEYNWCIANLRVRWRCPGTPRRRPPPPLCSAKAEASGTPPGPGRSSLRPGPGPGPDRGLRAGHRAPSSGASRPRAPGSDPSPGPGPLHRSSPGRWPWTGPARPRPGPATARPGWLSSAACSEPPRQGEAAPPTPPGLVTREPPGGEPRALVSIRVATIRVALPLGRWAAGP